MKKLFAILLVAVLTSCGASLEPPKSNTDYKNIIGKPIEFGNLEIAKYDFPDRIKWYDANKACAELGDGWRLPTEKEIYDILFYNKAKIGMLHSIYWSNSDGFDYDYAKSMSFIVDKSGIMESRKITKFYVRAVRTIK